jgi:hypothetical protein
MGFSTIPGPVQSSDFSYLRFNVGVSSLVGGTFASATITKIGDGKPEPEYLITDPTGSTSIYVGTNLTEVFQPGISEVRLGIIDPSQTLAIELIGKQTGPVGITGVIDMRDLENFSNGNTSVQSTIRLGFNTRATGIIQPLKPIRCSNLSLAKSGFLGLLDLTNFQSLQDFTIESCGGVTGIIHGPSTEPVESYYANTCGLTGNHDMTMFTRLGGQFVISNNPNLRSIGHTGSTASFELYIANGCGLTGNHDMTMLTGFGGQFQIYANPNLRSIGHTASTNHISGYYAYSCGLTGNHDLTMLRLAGEFAIYSNTNLRSIGHTGSTHSISLYHAYSCGLTGNHDMTMFPLLGGDFRISNNTNLRSIGHTASPQTFSNYVANNCGLTGNHDMTMLTGLGGTFNISNNPSLKTIGHTGSTAIFTSYNASLCGLTGGHDFRFLSGLGGSILLHSNTNLTSIAYPTSGQVITTYHVHDCNLEPTLDLRSLSLLGGSIRLDGNSRLEVIKLPSNSQPITLLQANNCNLTGIGLDIRGLRGLGGDFVVNNNPLLDEINHGSTGSTYSFSSYVANDCSINTINFNVLPNITNRNDCVIELQNNGMTRDQVDTILIDLNSTAISGYAGRKIYIDGTNAAPTPAGSGLVAKAELEVKGFAVFTN